MTEATEVIEATEVLPQNQLRVLSAETENFQHQKTENSLHQETANQQQAKAVLAIKSHAALMTL
jgi:hypothetical protein